MTNEEIIPGFDEETDDSLQIKLQQVSESETTLILYLTGYIDTYNSNFFQKRIAKAIGVGFIQLIFHCAGLNYVSSTGIGSFTAFLKSVKPKGGDLVLLQIQPKVYEVFQLLGFSQFFSIKDTLDNAIAHFSQSTATKRKSLFPKIFACPICSAKLKTSKAGRFRCSNCKTILAVDSNAQVFLG